MDATACGQAIVMLTRSMEKHGAEAELSYSLTGKLYLSKSGWLLLHVPNALRLGAFQALNEHGIELPPGHGGGLSQAHISVCRPEELAAIPGGAEAITERGKEYGYTLGPLRVVEPAGWEEMSKCWLITVRSPDLEKLRKSYGLSPLPNGNQYPFHITVAVRRKHILRHNDVSKAAGWIHRASQIFGGD